MKAWIAAALAAATLLGCANPGIYGERPAGFVDDPGARYYDREGHSSLFDPGDTSP